MRASIYVLGPLLAAAGEARVSLPGGCAFGPRPVNLHIEGMEALGAEIDAGGRVHPGRVPGGRLAGGRFRFEPSSVGGTCNVLMAAVLAAGESVLENCAVEPEVTQLVEALIGAGARIEGVGTTTLKIEGVEALAPLAHAVIADRIEAGTFMAGRGHGRRPGAADGRRLRAPAPGDGGAAGDGLRHRRGRGRAADRVATAGPRPPR